MWYGSGLDGQEKVNELIVNVNKYKVFQMNGKNTFESHRAGIKKNGV